MSDPNKHKGDICRNCKLPLAHQENFCPACGQKNDIRRLSLMEYISEALGNFFSFDSKIIQSLIPFFFKPGVLSRQYVDGQRARYVVPFRMYMFFSVLFFLVAGLTKEFERSGPPVNLQLPDQVVSQNQDTIQIDSLIQIVRDSLESEGVAGEFAIDQAILYASENPDSSAEAALRALGWEVSEQLIADYDLWTKFIRMDQAEFAKHLLNQLPLIIFLFIPLLASALKLLYIRRNIFYSEHLTFLFQSNSMIFLLATLAIVLKRSFSLDFIQIFVIVFNAYFLLAMKNFYQQSWLKTIFKFFLVLLSYAILLPIFIIGSLLVLYYFY